MEQRKYSRVGTENEEVPFFLKEEVKKIGRNDSHPRKDLKYK